ncbi:hypothetical protein Tco_0173542 [Tanacetum coccineum]
MPRAIVGDIPLTKSYIPKVSKTPGISPTVANFYKSIEDRCIHEGRVVDQLYYTSHYIDHCFSNVRLNCLYEINEPIVPRFILDFYSQVTLQRDDSGHIHISFMIQNEFITLSLAQFGQILKIPYNGQVVFTNEWDLSFLEYFQETEGPYHTDLPTPDEIHQFLRFEHVDSNRTIKNKFVTLTPNQVLTKELSNNIIWPTSSSNELKVLRPLQNPIFLMARHFVSSLSTHHFGSLSHQEDDDNDDGTSRASTPSPTNYLNSIQPLNYQRYDIPTSSQQDDNLLFERQTELLNQTQQIHKEVRGGFKSFGKALRGVFGKKKK